MKLICF